MNTLRPTKFKDLIGQQNIKQRLQISINAAKQRKQLLGHVLLDGPPGLGKTTIAGCIASQLKKPFITTIGPALSDIDAATEFIMGVKKPSVVFIDETHCIPIEVQEFLYPVLEDGFMEVDCSDETSSIRLPEMTIIGATTSSGKISAPFRDRFPNRYHLEYYTDYELRNLIQKNSRSLGLDIDGWGLIYLAKVSRGTPRIANSRLLWVRDFVKKKKFGEETVKKAMEKMGVDHLGLEKQDREVLKSMSATFGNRPVGIKALATTVGINEETLENEIEPWLLRCELIMRTPRGRQLTQKGKEYLDA